VIKCCALLTAILVNLYLLPGEPADCDFESTVYNKMFLIIVVAPELTLRTICACFYRSNAYVEYKNIFLQCLTPILAAGWWIYTLSAMELLTTQCYEPYPSYSLCIYLTILILIIPQAFLVICIASFLILFCPCLTWIIVKSLYDQRERAMIKERVIQSLSKIAYDPNKFRHQKTCSICFEDFKEEDTITPLSCDIRHYFHSDCIEMWMKEKN